MGSTAWIILPQVILKCKQIARDSGFVSELQPVLVSFAWYSEAQQWLTLKQQGLTSYQITIACVWS